MKKLWKSHNSSLSEQNTILIENNYKNNRQKIFLSFVI